MKLFITGASGFIGGAIAKELSNNNEVYAMARSPQSARKIEALGAIPVSCELTNITPHQLKGIDAVIHCAAHAADWGTEKEFYDANVLGTAHLVGTAKKAGVSRFVFMGTEAAFFDGHDLHNINETIQYPRLLPYLYSRTKAEAEQIVLNANDDSFATLSIRPRLVWGPGDQSILPTIAQLIEERKFAWINHGAYQTSTTHIDNLVHAVEQGLILGKGGEAYFVADEGTVSVKEFFTAYLGSRGIQVPDKSLPKSLARNAARATELIWRIGKFNSKPPLVRFSVDMMSANCTINTDKAKRELKYKPMVSREAGIQSLRAQ